MVLLTTHVLFASRSGFPSPPLTSPFCLILLLLISPYYSEQVAGGEATTTTTTITGEEDRCLKFASDPMKLQKFVHWNSSEKVWSYSFPYTSSPEGEVEEFGSSGGVTPTQIGLSEQVIKNLEEEFGREKVEDDSFYKSNEFRTCRKALSLPFRTRDQLVEAFKGKHILFVGDSTVRGIALNLLAMMCNPTWFDQCQQVANYPFMNEGYSNCMNCSKKQMREYSFVSSSSSSGSGGAEDESGGKEGTTYRSRSAREEERALEERWAHVETRNRKLAGEVLPNICKKELEIVETWLPGLTEPRGYRTKAERAKTFWLEKRIPPMTTMKFRNVTVSTIEVGCNGDRNGAGKAWKYIYESRRAAKKEGKLSKTALDALEILSVKEEEKRWQQKLKDDAAKRKKLGSKLLDVDADDVGDDAVIHNPTEFPVVPEFDLMATSAMFHCKLKTDFHTVPLSERFYTQGPPIFKSMREELGIRTLWLETPYCSNSDCKAFRKHAERIQGLIFRKEGIPVFPTYFMTFGSMTIPRNRPVPTALENRPCLYVDPKHASLTCYRSMVTVFVRSVLNILMVPIANHGALEEELGTGSNSNTPASTPSVSRSSRGSSSTASPVDHERNSVPSGGKAAKSDPSPPLPALSTSDTGAQSVPTRRKPPPPQPSSSAIESAEEVDSLKRPHQNPRYGPTTTSSSAAATSSFSSSAATPMMDHHVVVRKNRGKYGMAQLGVDLRMVLLVVLIPAAALLYRLGGGGGGGVVKHRGGGDDEQDNDSHSAGPVGVNNNVPDNHWTAKDSSAQEEPEKVGGLLNPERKVITEGSPVSEPKSSKGGKRGKRGTREKEPPISLDAI